MSTYSYAVDPQVDSVTIIQPLRESRPVALVPFLSRDHVVGAVDPDHVHQMRLEANCCLEFHRRK
jgi:hypothetical protein